VRKVLLLAICTVCILGAQLHPVVANSTGQERELVAVIEPPPAGKGWATPHLRDDMLVITSGDDAHLACYGLDELAMRWTLDAASVETGFEFGGFGNMHYSVVENGQYLFCSTYLGGQAVVVDRMTGEVITAKEIPVTRNALAVAGGTGELLVTTSWEELIIYDAQLEELYRTELPGQPNGIDYDCATGELYACVAKPPLICRYSLGGLVEKGVSVVSLEKKQAGPNPFACCIAGDSIAISCWGDSTIRIHDQGTLVELAAYPALPEVGFIEYFDGCLYAASSKQAKDEYGTPGALIRIDPATGDTLRRDLTDLNNVIMLEPYVVPGTLYCQDFGDMYLRNDAEELGLPFAYFLNSRVAVIDPVTLQTQYLLEYPDGLYGTTCCMERGLVVDVECGSAELKVYRISTGME